MKNKVVKLQELLFSEARKSDVVEFRKANNIWIRVYKKLKSMKTYGAFASFFNKDKVNGYFHSFDYKELDPTLSTSLVFQIEVAEVFSDVGTYQGLFALDEETNVPFITLNATKFYDVSKYGTEPEEYNEWFMVNILTLWENMRRVIIHELTHYLNSLSTKDIHSYLSQSYDYNEHENKIEFQKKVVKTYRNDMMKAIGTRGYEKKKQKFEAEEQKLKQLQKEFNVEYYNDDFELNAHFREVIYTFVRLLRKPLSVDNKMKIIGNTPQEFVDKFIMLYGGWSHLTPGNQKKVLSRAAQFYDTLKQKYLK